MTVDLSQCRPDVRERVVKNVVHEDAAQFHLAQIEQAKLAAYYRNAVTVGTTKPGVGPLQYVMHRGIKNWLAKRDGHANVYRDPDYMPWISKRHDEFRVPEVKQKIMVGWTPQVECAPKLITG